MRNLIKGEIYKEYKSYFPKVFSIVVTDLIAQNYKSWLGNLNHIRVYKDRECIVSLTQIMIIRHMNTLHVLIVSIIGRIP